MVTIEEKAKEKEKEEDEKKDEDDIGGDKRGLTRRK